MYFLSGCGLALKKGQLSLPINVEKGKVKSRTGAKERKGGGRHHTETVFRGYLSARGKQDRATPGGKSYAP